MQMSDLNEMAALVNRGIAILNYRVLNLLALLMDAFLFGWAMLQPEWQRILCASLFAAAAWVIVNLRRE